MHVSVCVYPVYYPSFGHIFKTEHACMYQYVFIQFIILHSVTFLYLFEPNSVLIMISYVPAHPASLYSM